MYRPRGRRVVFGAASQDFDHASAMPRHIPRRPKLFSFSGGRPQSRPGGRKTQLGPTTFPRGTRCAKAPPSSLRPRNNRSTKRPHQTHAGRVPDLEGAVLPTDEVNRHLVGKLLLVNLEIQR